MFTHNASPIELKSAFSLVGMLSIAICKDAGFDCVAFIAFQHKLESSIGFGRSLRLSVCN